jgi:RNA 2',3'-cyclic 3'-phosphodiesterase
VKCVAAENLHATLCFIGAVAPENVGRLESAASGLRAGQVDLRFDALEFWQGPRVICATAAGNSGAALAASLAQAATAAGFTLDLKPFRAHLTLARKLPPTRAASIEWPLPLTPPMLVRCDRFVLMESRPGESGSSYSVVNSWPLYAADTDSWPANIQ